MATTGKVSVPALKILTYTILMKAATGAAMLVCTAVAGISLRSGATDINMAGSVYVVCQTIEFINVVACVMCLGDISALSKHFVTTLRIMVAVLLIECFVLVPTTAGMMGSIVNNTAIIDAADAIVLALSAADRLLLGAAFLFFMRGFADSLRHYGDSTLAAALERLGIIYCIVSAAGVLALLMTGTGIGMPLIVAGEILSLVIVVLEVLIYIRVSGAAQMIWRKRAFGDSE